MINEILSYFGVHKAGLLLGVASNVIRAFEQEWGQDHDAKNAAIDALISVLQVHKNAPVPPKAEAKPVPPIPAA
jgi:hypothetical protein